MQAASAYQSVISLRADNGDDDRYSTGCGGDTEASLCRLPPDETHWPWYSYVAPTSWFVVGHVNHGRRFINLSTWVRPGKEPVDSIDRLKAMCREVGKGDMPLTSYKLIHWNSWLSADDVHRICEWSEAEQRRLSTVQK
jgi:hypothetical protein